MNEILLALVVYKCRFEDAVSFKSICQFNTKHELKTTWLIFDNSSLLTIDKTIQFDAFNVVNLVSSGVNEGLSVHYNTAFKVAESKEIPYVLLLDQDTEFIAGTAPYIDAIPTISPLIVVPKVKANGMLLSPSKIIFERGFFTNDLTEGVYSLDKYSPINSGSLIHTQVWKAAEGFNENILLDFTDFSFYNRVKQKGIKEFKLIDYVLNQNLSTFEKDETKIIDRFGLYMSDLETYQKEKKIKGRILLKFWGTVHFLKVLLRTNFNLKVVNLYFSNGRYF